MCAQLGELLIFEDCLIVKGSAICLSRGYPVLGPVDRAVVGDPSGRSVASSGDLIFVDGSTIELEAITEVAPHLRLLSGFENEDCSLETCQIAP